MHAKPFDTHSQRHLYVVAGNDRARQPHSQRLSEKDLAQEWRLRISGPAVKGEEGRRYTEHRQPAKLHLRARQPVAEASRCRVARTMGDALSRQKEVYRKGTCAR